MPKYQATFDDGSTREVEAANITDAKAQLKRQALNETGASVRSDARVKVRYIVNLDEKPGPTDPRTHSASTPARQGGGNY
jgi:hypothetical protein